MIAKNREVSKAYCVMRPNRRVKGEQVFEQEVIRDKKVLRVRTDFEQVRGPGAKELAESVPVPQRHAYIYIFI